MEKLKVLSLFSGIGAFEKALTNIGVDYKLVGFSEIDRWAIESYCAIHGVDEELNLGNIEDIDISNVPYADLITYGFPCQDISISGSGKGIREGSRSGLLYNAEEIINNIQPKYAIAENVDNLIGSAHKEDFEKYLSRLEGYGYTNKWAVLDAQDFGVPQSRKRVFIVSIRKDVESDKFTFPEPTPLKKTLVNYLLSDVDKKYNLNKGKENNSIVMLKGKKLPFQDISYCIDANYHKGTNLKGYLKSRRRQLVECKHSQEIRRLSPQECWRLMGFDDEDYFKAKRALEDTFYNGRDSSDTQMYRQAGNSIVVDVLEEIFKNLLL